MVGALQAHSLQREGGVYGNCGSAGGTATVLVFNHGTLVRARVVEAGVGISFLWGGVLRCR